MYPLVGPHTMNRFWEITCRLTLY